MIEKYDISHLPYPEIRRLVSDIEGNKIGSDVDKRVLTALKHSEIYIHPTTSLADAIGLIPKDWWWSISHLEACITPTVYAPGFEGVMHNSMYYDKKGRPISHRASVNWDRSNLPAAICAAMLKAVYNLPTAYFVDACATDEEDIFDTF